MIDEEEMVCPDCGYHETHTKRWHEVGDPLVTIIGFWPVEERNDHMGYENRWVSRCHYRTACAHCHWDLQIIEEPNQAVIPPGIPVIGVEEPYAIEGTRAPAGNSTALEPGGDIIEMLEFDHPPSATYILGNTHYQRPSEHFALDFKIGITMDDPEIAGFSPLYSNQVIPLIWYDRRLKGI